MKDKKKSSLLYVIVGIIAGYLSFFITQELQNNLFQPFLALFLLFITAEFMKMGFKINKKFKWFVSNGGWAYIFIWFVTWVVFYNL